jgi:hypothetical protein
MASFIASYIFTKHGHLKIINNAICIIALETEGLSGHPSRFLSRGDTGETCHRR